MKLLRTLGDTPYILLVFVIIIFATQGHAGGGFATASERTQMCSAAANTITSSTTDTCASPIRTESGALICPSTRTCAQILEEAACEDGGNCPITTPGRVVTEALEEQLEVTP